MLSPEVWCFPPPKSERKLLCNLSRETISKEINRNPFYHNISIVCSDTVGDIPSQVKDIFRESVYYKLSCVSLSVLFERSFIEGYIDKGSVSCLSVDVDANIDNIVSITEKGECVLLFNPETYHKFGVNGKEIKRNKSTSFYINVKLSGSQFKLQHKYYQRLYEQSKLLQTFTLIICWQPQDNEICPSSIAKYFDGKGIRVERCTPTLSIKRQHITNIPLLSDDCSLHRVVEWMGMVAIGGDLLPDEDFVSKYSTSCENNTTQGFITAYNINGLFSNKFVTQLENVLRVHLNGTDICKWYGLSCQTFTDAPKLTWESERKCLPEDNILVFLFDKDKSFLTKYLKMY